MSTGHHRPARYDRPSSAAPGPPPARLAGLLARAWLEVRARRRPLDQLSGLLAPAARRRLAAQVVPRERAGPIHPIRVRRVAAVTPAPKVCEAAVVVEQAGRCTAVAVRLEHHQGRWRAVELTAPEAGLPPLRTASLPPAASAPDAFDEVLAEEG